MELPFSISNLSPYLITTLLLLLLVEQISYWTKKRFAPGPTFVFPFLGNAIPLVRDPTKFWDTQSSHASQAGFSANYLIGKFILFVRDTELSHRIFNNVKPEAFMLVGHPFGRKLFGEHNVIYMFGQDHKDLRGRFAPNFTPKALSTYINIQQDIILKHLQKWAELASNDKARPITLRLLVRDMNLETSQTVFVGSYLGEEERERFCSDYNLFNVGTMALPIDLPGFAFREARLAVDRLVKTLGECSRRSKVRMGSREKEPECLIDFWMKEMVKEIAAAKAGLGPEPPHSTDRKLGGHLFDFLFAAQDASTSSLLWAVTLLESHPDVLSKVRKEVSRIWSPDKGKGELLTAESIREMKYTQAVVREILRFRPPATLVPHIAMGDFKLTESYTIPKGTIVFPSVYESCFQGFTDPNRFDPERFSDERKEDQVFKRNYLAFGTGPHQCVGQRYAINHLVLFTAVFVTMFDFKRHRTDGCDDIIYNPTISPKDECRVFLSRRGSWDPATLNIPRVN